MAQPENVRPDKNEINQIQKQKKYSKRTFCKITSMGRYVASDVHIGPRIVTKFRQLYPEFKKMHQRM